MISIFTSLGLTTLFHCFAGKLLLFQCHKFTFNVVVLAKNAMDGDVVITVGG